MSGSHTLRCHCGAFALTVRHRLETLVECNCLSCARSGFIHWKVPVEAVELVTQSQQLSVYLWRDAHGGHHFCPTCGTAVMRTGYGDQISLNARCLVGVDVFALEISRYDGRQLMPPGPLD